MLTKDLLKFRRAGKAIKPQFIDAEDKPLLDFAAELMEIYNVAAEKQQSRGEIAEIVEPLLTGARDQKFIRGLNKLILDRCEFSIHDSKDYASLRHDTFALAVKLFNKADLPDADALYAAVMRTDPDISKFVANGIYADLPDNERLTKFRTLFPKELLQRYNCSLVQSLLIYSERLELKVVEPEPAKLRKMFKYLKFFRLLAMVETIKGTVNGLKFTIDGPASLFENSRKYGLQLAIFFPAVCDLAKWQLKADIKLNNKVSSLNLNESTGLVSHYRNFSAYVPEEIVMFHRLFKQQVDDWLIVGDAPFIKPSGRDVIFPDLSFQSTAGKVIHLELFHRWHSGPLLQRLEQLAGKSDIPLIIGVDRALYNKPEIRLQLDGNKVFEQRGFLFRDFPGVDRVRKVLNSVCMETLN
ncbi:MAG: DUF790 family protein [Victivallaceae bacterium]|nr:DUF790 family protein [Victivallaceae bacterium]